MNRLAGYRTLLVNALIALAAFAGLHVSPEVIQRHVDIAVYAIIAINVFLRALTKGPVGQLVPQLAVVSRMQDRLSAIVAALPQVSIVAIPPAGADEAQPSSPVPASTVTGQSDVVALLPIYAAKFAQSVNASLSQTDKAT